MQDVTTTANLVDYEALEGGRSITAVLQRSEVEAALRADDLPALWFDIAESGNDETSRLTIGLPVADIDEMLRLSTGDEVVLALDADTVADLLEESEVEAHGLRGALTIAVVAGAIMAPTSLAAVPQTSSAAASPQVSSIAATQQSVSPAAESQVSSAAKPQVSRAVAKGQVSRAAKGQVSRAVAKPQVSQAAAKRQITALVVKAGGANLMKGGLAQ
jgi:hypothetical protein